MSALAIVYVITARLGLTLALPPEGKATAVWAPSGIALAAVLLMGYRIWPGIWLGAFLGNFWDFFNATNQFSLGTHLLVSGGIATGSTLQPLLGAYLLCWWIGPHSPLDQARSVFQFVAVALFMCLVASTIGVTTMALAGFAPWANYGYNWLTWWIGDTVGIFVVTPLILAWRNPPPFPWRPWRLAEAGILLGILVGVTLWVFSDWSPWGIYPSPLAYITVPPLVWASFRFGRHGATAALLLISGIAVWGTVQNYGPFVRDSLNESLLLLQAFLGILTMTALALAMVLAERERSERTQASLTQENEVLAELGRTVSSLDISQVFEDFAQQVRRLIPFDRIAMVIPDVQAGTVTTIHSLGHEISGLEVGTPRPLRGALLEQVIADRRGRLIQGQDPEQLVRSAPGATRGLQAGLVSVLMVPLISHDQVIGALVLRSLQPNCYTQHHLDLGERIGVQIGGAIASAQLYASLTEAEQEAQRERRRLQSVLETAPVGILVVDAEQKVHFANQEMERILGFALSAGEIMDRPIPPDAVFYRPDGTRYEKGDLPLERALATGEKVHAEEVYIEFRNSHRVLIIANATPILTEGDNVVGGILAIQDMSALELAQNARREFLGVISHEMRNPLSIIKGSAASVLRIDRPLDPGEVREFFQIIDNEADRLKDLIDNLLDINLIESGTLSVELVPLDLKLVLERTQENYIRTGSINRLVIETPDHLPRVLGDGNRIEQVLLNLAHNAAKFSPNRAPITVQIEPRPTEVTIYVRDKGIGIPPDQLPMLFQKFTRLPAQGAAQAQGTGLGLAICKGIIEAHGGRIWAESPGAGEGSTFCFTLPVGAEVSQPPSPWRSTESSISRTDGNDNEKRRILVVDDEKSANLILGRLLVQEGYLPVTTTDPAQVAQLVDSDSPELVLLDITLPGTTGFEVFREIRERSKAPIIFLTASNSQEDVKQARELGAAGYITKPYSPRELLAQMKAALQRERVR